MYSAQPFYIPYPVHYQQAAPTFGPSPIPIHYRAAASPVVRVFPPQMRLIHHEPVHARQLTGSAGLNLGPLGSAQIGGGLGGQGIGAGFSGNFLGLG